MFPFGLRSLTKEFKMSLIPRTLESTNTTITPEHDGKHHHHHNTRIPWLPIIIHSALLIVVLIGIAVFWSWSRRHPWRWGRSASDSAEKGRKVTPDDSSEVDFACRGDVEGGAGRRMGIDGGEARELKI
jgi:hypothetical protein